jgi:hypothetical protein
MIYSPDIIGAFILVQWSYADHQESQLRQAAKIPK